MKPTQRKLGPKDTDQVLKTPPYGALDPAMPKAHSLEYFICMCRMHYKVFFVCLNLFELVVLSLPMKTVLINAHSERGRKMKNWTQVWRSDRVSLSISICTMKSLSQKAEANLSVFTCQPQSMNSTGWNTGEKDSGAALGSPEAECCD